jgi:hypothetical protein
MRSAGVVLAALALAACGSGGAKPTDASADADGAVATAADARGDVAATDAVDGASAEAPAAGFRAYDLTATLTLTPTPGDGDFAGFSPTAPFTLAWDPGTGSAYVGAASIFSAPQIMTTDDRTFQSSAWLVGAPFSPSCTGAAQIDLPKVTFTLEGGALRGTATGEVTYPTSSGMFTAAATVTLVGASDVTPPTFMSPGATVDPLAPVFLPASEPLPMTASASLTSAPSGDTVTLSATKISNGALACTGFSASGRMLRYGETYTLVTDHAADFAGNKPSTPVTFTTRAAPPLVPEDGFESVTGTMFAGAGVLNGGPLTPIAGATSLLLNTGYGGGFGFLPYDLGSSLAVRLAVAPGDTVVRFDAQLIAPDPIDAAAFVGAIRLGSVGGTVVVQQNVAGSGFVEETLPELGDIFVSPVQTIELALPPDAAGEIAFEIVGEIDLCAQPPSPTVLVVDNLRVE